MKRTKPAATLPPPAATSQAPITAAARKAKGNSPAKPAAGHKPTTGSNRPTPQPKAGAATTKTTVKVSTTSTTGPGKGGGKKPAARKTATTSTARTRPVKPGTPSPTAPKTPTNQPAKQPAKKARNWSWLWWILIAVAVAGLVLFVLSKVFGPKAATLPKAVVAPAISNSIPAITPTNTVGAVSNAVSAAATNIAPSLAPSAPTNVPAAVPIAMKIEGDGNNGNTMLVNYGTVHVTETVGNAWASVDGGPTAAYRGHPAPVAAAPQGTWFPAGCLTWMSVEVPPNERNKDTYTVEVKVDQKQCIKVPVPPPGWKMFYSYQANGPLEKFIDGKPVADGNLPSGEVGFFGGPTCTECTLKISFRHLIKN